MTNWYVVYSVPLAERKDRDYYGYEFEDKYFLGILDREFPELVHALARATESPAGTVPSKGIEGIPDMEHASVLEIHLAIQVKYGRYVRW